MKKLIIALIGICAGIFLIGGVFTLLGAIFSFTFGVIGTILSGAFKILFNPVVLVIVIIFLAYKLNKKAA